MMPAERDAMREYIDAAVAKAVSEAVAVISVEIVKQLEVVLREEMARVEHNSPPGKDGRDGKDAVFDKDALVREIISLIPTPKDGRRGEKGADGRDGRDGKDAIPSLDNLRAEVAKSKSELREELPALAKTAVAEARAEDPWPVYREIWREGEYEKAAVVTWAGSAWIARERTNEKPGDGATKWKLFVKQGRDGRAAR